MLDVCLGFLTPCLIYLQGTNVDFLDLELWPHPLSLLFLPPKVALFRMQMYFFFSLGKIWPGLYCFSRVAHSWADVAVTAQLYRHGWIAQFNCGLI